MNDQSKDSGSYVVIAGYDYESLKILGSHATIADALAQYEQIKDDPQYRYKDIEHRWPEEETTAMIENIIAKLEAND